jgi:hypothetical protein
MVNDKKGSIELHLFSANGKQGPVALTTVM